MRLNSRTDYNNKSNKSLKPPENLALNLKNFSIASSMLTWVWPEDALTKTKRSKRIFHSSKLKENVELLWRKQRDLLFGLNDVWPIIQMDLSIPVPIDLVPLDVNNCLLCRWVLLSLRPSLWLSSALVWWGCEDTLHILQAPGIVGVIVLQVAMGTIR